MLWLPLINKETALNLQQDRTQGAGDKQTECWGKIVESVRSHGALPEDRILPGQPQLHGDTQINGDGLI